MSNSPSLELTDFPRIINWSQELQISLAFIPYQTCWLFLVGIKPSSHLLRPRLGDHTFSELALDKCLAAKEASPRCGLIMIELQTGRTVPWLRLEGLITELYDMRVLTGV